MEIKIIEPIGLCSSAYSILDQIKLNMDKYNNIYILGDILHNEFVINYLSNLGIKFVKDINDIKLFIIGNYNKVFREQELSNSISNNIRFLGRVSDEELVKLYNQAECFIFPTLYEGFGLPPLEAMACGCPVIVSDIPVER